MDFSLRVKPQADRHQLHFLPHQQFHHICRCGLASNDKVFPSSAVYSKKREMIGNFKNAGAKWDRFAHSGNDHDSAPMQRRGHLLRHYDPPHNRGSVCVGVSHDTPASPPHSIATCGNARVRVAGACSPAIVFWQIQAAATVHLLGLETEIQAHMCNAFGITITTLTTLPARQMEFPFEHRLFSEISKNWAAEPLDSYEKMLQLHFALTSTKTGLVVTAYWTEKISNRSQTRPESDLRRSTLNTATRYPQWNTPLHRICDSILS